MELGARPDRSQTIQVILTGGTIGKRYDPVGGGVRNIGDPVDSVVEAWIRSQRYENLHFTFHSVMDKDSIEFTDSDRKLIADSIGEVKNNVRAILVVHGTDTLTATMAFVARKVKKSTVPIIFTGAMLPIVIQGSDGQKNLIEAVIACQLLPPGMYVVFHGQVLPWPDVIKDKERQTFTVHGSGTSGELMDQEFVDQG